MANMRMDKNPMPEQDPVVRAGNFDEVALGYTPEMAMDEAKRCLNCHNKMCIRDRVHPVLLCRQPRAVWRRSA